MLKRLCVWNLSPETTRDDLHSLFGQVARVISIDVRQVRGNGDQSTEPGFVEIETTNISRVIQKVLVTELDGRTLRVSESLPCRVAIDSIDEYRRDGTFEFDKDRG